MANTVQLKKNGQIVYPITDRACIIGLNEGPLMEFIYAWDGSGTPVPANIPAGVQVTYDGTTYTGTLAASASTSGYIYLVYNPTSTEYDRYGTDATGGSYAWKAMGDTTIQSPDIADDLVTNDSTKALSAKQGKILNEEVEGLEAELTKVLVREITKVDDLSNLVGQDGKYVDRDGQVQSYATYAISIPFSMLKGDVIKVFGMESSGTATLAKVESGVYTPVYSANIIKQQTFVYEAEEDEDIVVSFSKSVATGAYISVERLDGYEDYPLAEKSLNNGANYIDVSGLGLSGKIVLDFGTLQSTGNIYVGYANSQSEPAETSRYRIPGTNTPPVSVISPDSTTYVYVFTDFLANLKIYQGGTIDIIPSLEQGKQNKLTFDDVPTEGSENPVKSGGIKEAISFITSKSNYQEGKYVNFQGLDMDAPEWGLSEIIAYVSGSSIVWNYGAGNAVTTRCLVFLDSSKRFIANAYWSANDASGVRTISASDVSQYAPGAAYIKASFRLSAETPFVQVGSDKWMPKKGGDLEPSIIKKVKDNSFGNVYCEDAVTEKQMAFCGLFADAGKVDSFVFMTDPHLMGVNNAFDENGTFRPFLAVLQKFYKSIPASFLLCGGDWLNSGDYKAVATWKLGVVDSSMRKLFGADYRPVLGNHDTNYQGYVSESDDSAGTLSHDACVSILFNREGNTYYDFVTPNCHYYVLDTGLDRTLQMTSEQWAQIGWLGRKLAENTKDNVAIVMHEYSNAGDASQWTQKLFAIGTNVQLLMTAFNAKSFVTLNGVTYDFSNATGTCRFIICGHSHFDHIDTDGNIPVICSTNFTSGGVPTFDLVFVDFTEGELKTVRIGSGNDRTMELS